MKKEDKDSV